MASFICSRDEEDESNVSLIFPTLAFQLALKNDQFADKLVAVLKHDPDLSHGQPGEQFLRLIVEPLQNTGSQSSPIILVIDALDECQGNGVAERILLALAHNIHRHRHLRVFVSCRPTLSVEFGFLSDPSHSYSKIFVLHDVEPGIVAADILTFFKQRLKSIRARHSLPQSWPSSALLDRIAQKAGSLFIFAETVCKYIESPGDATRKLETVALLPETDSEGRSGIDALYSQIIEEAVHLMDDIDKDCCARILSTIAILHSPMSVNDIGRLLDIDIHVIRSILSGLHSVINVPENDNTRVRTFHTSFHDYITSEDRAHQQIYRLPCLQHRDISICLLETMITELPCIVVSDEERFKPNYDIQGLDLRLCELASDFLMYSCRYWTDHLSLVICDLSGAQMTAATEELDDGKDQLCIVDFHLKGFIEQKLLNWLEFLSLLNSVPLALRSLCTLARWLSVCHNISSNAYFQLSIYRIHIRPQITYVA